MLLGIHPLLEVVLVLLFAGFIAWVIGALPFVAEPYRKIAQGFLLFACLIWLVLDVYGFFVGPVGTVHYHRW